MLPQVSIGICGLLSQPLRDEPELCRAPQQRNVAEIVGEARMHMGMAQDQRLDHEFDVDHAAAVVLEIEEPGRVWMSLMHLVSHGKNLLEQGATVSRHAQDFDAGIFKGPANVLMPSTKAGPGERLMLPGPGLLRLVAQESREV